MVRPASIRKAELWGQVHRAQDMGETGLAIRHVRRIRELEASERAQAGRNHPTRLRRWGRR